MHYKEIMNEGKQKALFELYTKLQNKSVEACQKLSENILFSDSYINSKEYLQRVDLSATIRTLDEIMHLIRKEIKNNE